MNYSQQKFAATYTKHNLISKQHADFISFPKRQVVYLAHLPLFLQFFEQHRSSLLPHLAFLRKQTTGGLVGLRVGNLEAVNIKVKKKKETLENLNSHMDPNNTIDTYVLGLRETWWALELRETWTAQG